jgi:hypothetical protein
VHRPLSILLLHALLSKLYTLCSMSGSSEPRAGEEL